MSLEIIPQSLFNLSNIKVMLRDSNATILYKLLTSDLLDKAVFITTPLILYVSKGAQAVSNPDGRRVTVNEGEMIFFPKDVYLVSDYVTDRGVFEATLFFLSDDVLGAFFAQTSSDRVDAKQDARQEPVTMKATDQISDYIKSLQSVYLNGSTSKELVSLKSLELLYLIPRPANNAFLQAVSQLRLSPKKRDLEPFMEKYFCKNLRLEDYAMLTGRSVSAFVRDFKKTYNLTPNQWIIDKRLQKARALLEARGTTVTDVAIEVGYESVSHFISAYKKRFGVTPKKQMQVGQRTLLYSDNRLKAD